MTATEPAPPIQVHSITGARDPHSQDLNVRMRRYLISMAIRTVCVVLAVVVPGPLRWVFIVGAVLLPYVAVIMANASGAQRGRNGGPAPTAKVALPSQASPLVVDLGAHPAVPGDEAPSRRAAEWLSAPSSERTT